jgi:ribosomal-protein-serine acetyltransferase
VLGSAEEEAGAADSALHRRGGVTLGSVSRLPERIEAAGLLLRRWQVDDAEVLQQAIAESADHLRPWMRWLADEPMTLKQRRELIARWEKEWSEGGDVYLGVFVDGRIAGGCGLHRRRGAGALEIGYWIHRAFLRRGIATEVARVLTDTALAVPRVTRVEIHHDKANSASAAIPRQLGYRFIGEGPGELSAPAEVGIDLTWRIEAAQWESARARGSARST